MQIYYQLFVADLVQFVLFVKSFVSKSITVLCCIFITNPLRKCVHLFCIPRQNDPVFQVCLRVNCFD